METRGRTVIALLFAVAVSLFAWRVHVAPDTQLDDIPIAAAGFVPDVSQLVLGTGAADFQQEVLVFADGGTVMPIVAGRRAVEVQNLGPNNIFCEVGGTAVWEKARMVAPDTAFALSLSDKVPLNCIATGANQATGNATIMTQLK